MSTHFSLFANCLPVKGYNRSLMMDLQRDSSDLIPNSMFEVIHCLTEEGLSLEQLFANYGEENKETLQEYLDFLIDKEYGFFCDAFDRDHLPKLASHSTTPEFIQNAILEIESCENAFLEHVMSQLNDVGCKFITIFYSGKMTETEIRAIIEYTNHTCLLSVELIFNFTGNEALTQLFDLIDKTPNKLISITIYNYPEETQLAAPADIDLILLPQNLDGFKQCGVIRHSSFNTNLPKVMESLNHNSCLHKKIAINGKGEIRNCPAMSTVLGTIQSTTLRNVVDTPELVSLWSIKKDQISGCRDCEFRHICTDCRAFIENPDDVYSKPLKCGYDPYTNRWSEWASNPLKKKTIEHYQLIRENDFN